MSNRQPVLSDALLTDREIEIVRLLADGLTNQHIANQTGLTLYTVKWYLKQIYGKLYVANRTQAVTKVRELGLLTEEVPRAARDRSSLPERVTPFFGRQSELERLEGLLRDDAARLITIYGIGGMGKTSLAIETARQVRYLFPDGVFFVPLAHCHGNPFPEIVQVLKHGGGDGAATVEDISAILYDKRCLLVLDNFETFLNYAGDLSALLQRTRYLHLLVTSREILQLRNETVFPLDGLVTERAAADEMDAASQLFLQCARTALPAFAPTPADWGSINAICQLVGGMPLAIEMAASWVSVLSVEETHQNLVNSLDLLTIEEKDRPLRQQSVRATFDYSFQLLPTETRQVLVTLGVFQQDGFTLAAAQAVTGLTPQQIKQLNSKALIQRNGERFQFHPLIRQYVTEILHQDAELNQKVQTAHATYYLNYAAECLADIQDELDMAVVRRFMPEHHNFVQAWFTAIQQGRYAELEPLVDIGGIYDLANLWMDADVLFAESLWRIPEDQFILRGRILTYRAIFALRANSPENTYLFTQEVTALLLDTPYVHDAAVALCHNAMAEIMVQGKPEQGFATLDCVDQLLEQDDLHHNAYSRLLVECARPAALFYAGRFAEALPLFETLSVPIWYEIRLYLAETYIHLDMLEKARSVLLEQYSVGCHYGNSPLAIGSAFMLAVLDTPTEELPAAITQCFLEAVNQGLKYPVVAIHHWAILYARRGYYQWAMLVFNSNIQALHELGETFLMYRSVLRTAQVLQMFQHPGSDRLLSALIADEQCPAEIKEQVSGQQVQAAPDDSRSLLEIVSEVLLDTSD